MSNNIEGRKTVFVGLSGGVDSAVSAYLLKNATPNNFKKLFGRPTPKGFRGYKVVGCFIKTWQPDFIDCSWKEERRDAMRVASHLEIPFLTIDLEKEYKQNVADYMIEEYRQGRTPNPDVMCNKEIKFGGFLKRALERGADFVATGHYARCINATAEHKKNTFQLFKAKDKAKEQSYFLWTLTQDQLKHILFPVGNLEKKEVRKIAKKINLPVASKKDSQGICFIGKIDFKDFLKHFIEEKKGDVLDEKGEIIGHHTGSVFLTLGERQGFTITKKGTNDKRMYIINKDIEKNTITVSTETGNRNISENKKTKIKNTNWIETLPEKDKIYEAQIRYHGEFLRCKINLTENNTAEIELEDNQIVASGQSIVFYDGEICVGGGVVN